MQSLHYRPWAISVLHCVSFFINFIRLGSVLFSFLLRVFFFSSGQIYFSLSKRKIVSKALKQKSPGSGRFTHSKKTFFTLSERWGPPGQKTSSKKNGGQKRRTQLWVALESKLKNDIMRKGKVKFELVFGLIGSETYVISSNITNFNLCSIFAHKVCILPLL